MVIRTLVDGGGGGDLQANRALQLLLQLHNLPLQPLRRDEVLHIPDICHFFYTDNIFGE